MRCRSRHHRLAVRATSSSGSSVGQAPAITRTARYSSITITSSHPFRWSVVVAVGARQQRIRFGDLLERTAELVSEIPGRDPQQDLPAFGAQPRVTLAATPAALFEKLICQAHRPSMARRPHRHTPRGRRTRSRPST